MAANQKVCVFSGMNLARSVRAGVPWRRLLLLSLLTCVAPYLIHAGGPRLEEKAGAEPEHYLFPANLDVNSLTEKIDDFTPQQSGGAAPTGGNFVIDRIEFTGNRRIRTDTLKARIFSRDGDPYNEETLRRDFQALWNTQFF